jgi:hypothetical protein
VEASVEMAVTDRQMTRYLGDHVPVHGDPKPQQV